MNGFGCLDLRLLRSLRKKYCPVPTPTCECCAIWTERPTINTIRMTSQCQFYHTCLNIPQKNCLVRTACKRLSIWAERYTADPIVISGECCFVGARCNVLQTHRPIITPTCKYRAIRTERYIPDHAHMPREGCFHSPRLYLKIQNIFCLFIKTQFWGGKRAFWKKMK